MAYHPLRNGKIEKANGSLKKTQGREKKRKEKKRKQKLLRNVQKYLYLLNVNGPREEVGMSKEKKIRESKYTR